MVDMVYSGDTAVWPPIANLLKYLKSFKWFEWHGMASKRLLATILKIVQIVWIALYDL